MSTGDHGVAGGPAPAEDRRAASALSAARAVWRYSRGRLPLRSRLLARGLVEVVDVGGTGLIVVLDAPARSPLVPMPLGRTALPALEAVGWVRTFLVWPLEGGRARLVGPATRWGAGRWERMRENAALADGGELRVWLVDDPEGRSALGLLVPGLRDLLGVPDDTPALAARCPELVRAIVRLAEARPDDDTT